MLQTVGNRDHRTGRTEPGKVGKSGILFLRSIWVGVEHFIQKILLENGTEKDKQEALKYEQGCILNSLHYGGMDGWIPIWIERNAPSREEMLKTRNPWKSNMHKPTLAQHAAFIVRNMNGDAEWLRDDFYTFRHLCI